MQADRRKGAETRRKDESRGNGVASVPLGFGEQEVGSAGIRCEKKAEQWQKAHQVDGSHPAEGEAGRSEASEVAKKKIVVFVVFF